MQRESRASDSDSVPAYKTSPRRRSRSPIRKYNRSRSPCRRSPPRRSRRSYDRNETNRKRDRSSSRERSRRIPRDEGGQTKDTTTSTKERPRQRIRIAPNVNLLGRIMQSTAKSRDKEDLRERQLADEKLAAMEK